MFMWFTATAYAATAAVESHAPTGIGALGINGQSLLFQIVNFLLLLVILRLFVYKPLLKMIEERRQMMAETVRNAEETKKVFEMAQHEKSEILSSAQQQAENIMMNSEKQAHQIINSAQETAKLQSERIIHEAQQSIKAEAKDAQDAIQKNIASFISKASGIVIQEKLDKKADQELIEDAIKKADTL